MWVSRYVVWLFVYSVIGWIYESTYCTITEHKWANRGFLYGPLCPIYGTGFIAMMAAWQAVLDAGMSVAPWQVFVVTALGSVVLEYVTSWAMEKLFNARWWDYSDMPLNINGRVCVPATILFGLMGLLVVYVLYTPTVQITDGVSPVLIEALSLLDVIIVSVDATLTVSALTQFAQMAASVNDNINEHMDAFVNEAKERRSMAAEKLEREREKFSREAIAARIGEMNLVVSSAAKRVHHFAPGGEQLEKVRRQLRD